jgi:hypothetical protein
MRRPDLQRALTAVASGLCLGAAVFAAGVGCSGWDPRSPFEHNAPEVDEALRELDAGRVLPAEETLEQYLATGPCSGDGGLILSPAIRQMPSGTFDLGLTLFALGEQFGQRFGEEEASDGGSQREKALAERRALEVGCALLIVRAIAADPTVPVELRARASYLAGNLEFMLRKYEAAVKEYDQALGLVPGLRAIDGGADVDGIGRDAAWNRAIALRRMEDQQDSGADAPDSSDGQDSSSDASDGSDGKDGSSGNDGGDKGDGGRDGGDKDDGGNDGGGSNDAGDQDDGAAPASPPPPQPATPPSATPQQDTRMLEMLEQQTPSYQEQEAKQRAHARRGRPTMEDK